MLGLNYYYDVIFSFSEHGIYFFSFLDASIDENPEMALCSVFCFSKCAFISWGFLASVVILSKIAFLLRAATFFPPNFQVIMLYF